MTATPGIALGVLAADCGPILFADSENGVIGAAHGNGEAAAGVGAAHVVHRNTGAGDREAVGPDIV